MSPPDRARQGATAAQAAVASFCAETRSLAAKFIPPLGARDVAEISALAPTATRIIDKTPSNFTLVGLIHLATPNARVIHAVRDPADISEVLLFEAFCGGSVLHLRLDGARPLLQALSGTHGALAPRVAAGGYPGCALRGCCRGFGGPISAHHRALWARMECSVPRVL